MRISDWSSDVCSSDLATLVDASNAQAVAAALRPETKLLLVEVVANPTLRVADIKGIAKLARERGLVFVVDNTFTTPRCFRPFEHGADVVVHSVTKLLDGHSDATLGFVAAKDPAHQQAIPDTRSEKHTSELQSLTRTP